MPLRRSQIGSTSYCRLEMRGRGLKSSRDPAAAGEKVLIVSSLPGRAEETVAALALGAAEHCPTGPGLQGPLEVMLGSWRAWPRRHDRDRARAVAEPPSVGALRAMNEGPVKLLALGASTGGIHALTSFFQELPPKIGASILVTQHLPEPFMAVFARQLSQAAGRGRGCRRCFACCRTDRDRTGQCQFGVEVGGGNWSRGGRQRSASGFLPSGSDARLRRCNAGGAASGGIFRYGRDGLEGAMALVGAGGRCCAG